MSRELLKKVLALPRRIEPLGGQNYSYVCLEDVTGLIELELEKPESEPILLVNVWTDRGQSCFNIEWIKNPIYWDDGNYSLYTKPPAKPEPIAIVGDVYSLMWYGKGHYSGVKVGDLLYTHPPEQQKPLSDDEILQIIEGGEALNEFTLIAFARAIEKYHGIE